MSSSTQPILVVEDSIEDYEALVRTFMKARLANRIIHCSDGDQALEFLHRRASYDQPDQLTLPGVILLDLNLPGTDGREVLAEVKRDKDLKDIPIIILTSCMNDQDMRSFSQYGGVGYMVKPIQFEAYIKALQKMKEYCFEIAIQPNGVMAAVDGSPIPS